MSDFFASDTQQLTPAAVSAMSDMGMRIKSTSRATNADAAIIAEHFARDERVTTAGAFVLLVRSRAIWPCELQQHTPPQIMFIDAVPTYADHLGHSFMLRLIKTEEGMLPGFLITVPAGEPFLIPASWNEAASYFSDKMMAWTLKYGGSFDKRKRLDDMKRSYARMEAKGLLRGSMPWERLAEHAEKMLSGDGTDTTTSDSATSDSATSDTSTSDVAASDTATSESDKTSPLLRHEQALLTLNDFHASMELYVTHHRTQSRDRAPDHELFSAYTALTEPTSGADSKAVPRTSRDDPDPFAEAAENAHGYIHGATGPETEPMLGPLYKCIRPESVRDEYALPESEGAWFTFSMIKDGLALVDEDGAAFLETFRRHVANQLAGMDDSWSASLALPPLTRENTDALPRPVCIVWPVIARNRADGKHALQQLHSDMIRTLPLSCAPRFTWTDVGTVPSETEKLSLDTHIPALNPAGAEEQLHGAVKARAEASGTAVPSLAEVKRSMLGPDGSIARAEAAGEDTHVRKMGGARAMEEELGEEAPLERWAAERSKDMALPTFGREYDA